MRLRQTCACRRHGRARPGRPCASRRALSSGIEAGLRRVGLAGEQQCGRRRRARAESRARAPACARPCRRAAGRQSRRRHRSGGSGSGVNASTSTPEPGMSLDPLRRHADLAMTATVVRILHQHGRLGRRSSQPSNDAASTRSSRPSRRADVNAKPRPAKALSTRIGRPSAAIEPITTGNNAT